MATDNTSVVCMDEDGNFRYSNSTATFFARVRNEKHSPQIKRTPDFRPHVYDISAVKFSMTLAFVLVCFKKDKMSHLAVLCGYSSKYNRFVH